MIDTTNIAPGANAFQLREDGTILRSDSRAWRVSRVRGRELFRAPDGLEYVRVPDVNHPGATAAIAWPNLGTMYLRSESGERLENIAARRERRATEREEHRKRRAT